MSNESKAVNLIGYADLPGRTLHPLQVEAIVLLLKEAGLLASDTRIIRTPEELEALELVDADAVVVASEAGAVRTVRALAAMHRLGSVWGLPAVVIATGAQVRAAREALEVTNE